MVQGVQVARLVQVVEVPALAAGLQRVREVLVTQAVQVASAKQMVRAASAVQVASARGVPT